MSAPPMPTYGRKVRLMYQGSGVESWIIAAAVYSCTFGKGENVLSGSIVFLEDGSIVVENYGNRTSYALAEITGISILP